MNIMIELDNDFSIDLSDGVYEGEYGGYIIDIFYKGKLYLPYSIKTLDGVRGFGYPVVVTVKNNKVIEAKYK